MAARVRGCPDVVGLSAGPFGTVSTPVPGGRVDGVAVRPDSVEIGVVVRFERPLPEIADGIRDLVHPIAHGRRVLVAIEDVLTDPPRPDGGQARGDPP
nr:hypothetical protein [Murinocardiopsis flavida]